MKRFCCIYSFKCNLDCINCIVDRELRNTRDHTLDEMTNGLEMYQIKKDDILEMSGGEPTLNKELFINFTRYLINEKGIKRDRINVLSNALAFSDIDFVKMSSNYFGNVTSTFYGATEKVHDSFTQTPDSCAQKMMGLKNLKDEDVELHIKFLITKQNYESITSFIDMCATNFEEAHIVLTWLRLVGEAWKNRNFLAMKLSNASSNIEKAVERARECGLNLSITVPLCIIDPYYWEGTIPSGLYDGLEKVVYITHARGVFEKSPSDVPLLAKPTKCNSCILKNKCAWEWEGYDKYYGDFDSFLNPLD